MIKKIFIFIDGTFKWSYGLPENLFKFDIKVALLYIDSWDSTYGDSKIISKEYLNMFLALWSDFFHLDNPNSQMVSIQFHNSNQDCLNVAKKTT